MDKIKIAIIREGKIPADSRAPLSPSQAQQVQKKFSNVEVKVQSSPNRCFSDQEYEKKGIKIVDRVDDCDVLLGVKEVPVDQLIPDKTYFFFSHTIKKQPYNKVLLQEILKKNIKLIDYECLVDIRGIRIIAFGRWAGIVGAYNALWTYGKKHQLFDIKRACQCKDHVELQQELKNIQLAPIKILITGNGRVAKGCVEIMEAMNIKNVEPAPFFYQTFDVPVFTQADVNTYYRHKKGHPFHFDHFFKHPDKYVSDFVPFTHQTDILINAVFWDPKAPQLFTFEDMRHDDFKIEVIADITCDIDGSIPSTIRATSIEDPVYDFDPEKGEFPAFSDEGKLSVMSIDNLPNELPRDASEDFGKQLTENILPFLITADEKGIIKNATIVENGKLTKPYEYLQDYVS